MTRPKLALAMLTLGLVVVLLPQLWFRVYRNVGTRPADPLWIINAAQNVYSQAHPDKGFATTLSELGNEQLIDPLLTTGRKSGYLYTLRAAPPDASGRVAHYTIVARPQKYAPGSLSFFADESGVERFTTEDRDATVNDPPRPHEK